MSSWRACAANAASQGRVQQPNVHSRVHTVSTQRRAAYTAHVRRASTLPLAGDTVSCRCSADLQRRQALCAWIAGGGRVAAQLCIEGPCRGHRHRTQPHIFSKTVIVEGRRNCHAFLTFPCLNELYSTATNVSTHGCTVSSLHPEWTQTGTYQGDTVVLCRSTRNQARACSCQC